MTQEYESEQDVVRIDLTQRGDSRCMRGMATPEDPTGLTPLTEAYDAIVMQGGVYFPVAYQFVRELGRGRQG